MQKRELIGGIVVFISIVLLTITDIAKDALHGVTTGHLLTETTILLISVGGLLLFVKKYLQLREDHQNLSFDLKKAHEDLDHWKNQSKETLKSLSEAIDHQFDSWKMTPAEKEIGLLILKGLSFKEIAGLRKTSERTVRHQSLEIYRKSRLANRSEFAAFFLDDL